MAIVETQIGNPLLQQPPVQLPARLNFRVISNAADLAASRDAWNELAGDHPFLRWEWITAWWTTYGVDRQAAVLVVADQDGRWVGLFPLQIERRPFWGRVLSNMANGRACSDHVRPIVAAGFEQQALRGMANWISEQLSRGKVDLIEWDGVDVADPGVETLLAELGRVGIKRHDGEIEGSWIADLPAEWSEFEGKTKKCFRRKMQKARRNLELPGVEIEFCRTGDEIRKLWPSFIQLHEARRDQKDERGCFQEPGFAEFLLEAATKLARRGDGMLLLAKLDGKPFGAMLLILGQTTVYMYQSGYDPKYAHLEPGHLLATCGMQFAIKQRRTKFDFLRGDEPYKARWNTVRKPMLQVRAVPRRFFPRLRMWLWQTQSRLKRGRNAQEVTEGREKEEE